MTTEKQQIYSSSYPSGIIIKDLMEQAENLKLAIKSKIEEFGLKSTRRK